MHRNACHGDQPRSVHRGCHYTRIIEWILDLVCQSSIEIVTLHTKALDSYQAPQQRKLSHSLLNRTCQNTPTKIKRVLSIPLHRIRVPTLSVSLDELSQLSQLAVEPELKDSAAMIIPFLYGLLVIHWERNSTSCRKGDLCIRHSPDGILCWISSADKHKYVSDSSFR